MEQTVGHRGCDRPETPDQPRDPAASPLSTLARALELADSLEEQIIFLDPRLTIAAANRAWKVAAEGRAGQDLSIGDNYLHFYRSLAERGDIDAKLMAAGLQCVADGSLSRFEHLDSEPREGGIFRVHLSSLVMAGGRWLIVSRYDLTDLFARTLQRVELGGRLLKAQDQERRRLARELHDSTSQYLVALQHGVGRLKEQVRGSERSFSEVTDLLEGLQREIRSLSFLYHPPGLEGLGLAGAIQALGEGFSRRTGLQLSLLLDYPAPRPAPIEMALYRVAQEALANIHRHGKATEVAIRLSDTKNLLRLSVRDDSAGSDPKLTGAGMGVGLSSVRQRVAELGGLLSLRGNARGTALIARIPVRHSAASQDQASTMWLRTA